MDFDEVLVRIKAAGFDVKVRAEVDPCSVRYPTRKLGIALAGAIRAAGPARTAHLIATAIDYLAESGDLGTTGGGACDQEEDQFVAAALALCEAWEKYDKIHGVEE